MADAKLSACIIPVAFDPNKGWCLFWAKRQHTRSFLPGFHAFLGGGLEDQDRRLDDAPTTQLASCAVRECFEESGVWLGAPEDAPSQGDRLGLLLETIAWDELVAQRDWGMQKLHPVGRWTTPVWSTIRFETEFFAVDVGSCDSSFEGDLIEAELHEGEWISADEALRKHQRGEVLLTAPTISLVRHFVAHAAQRDLHQVPRCDQEEVGALSRYETLGGMQMVALKSPTIPPATHTNCYVVHGERSFVVIDPGSVQESELSMLFDVIDALLERGLQFEAIVATHHHQDHVCGIEVVQERYKEKEVQVWAHQENQAYIDLRLDRRLEEGDRIDLGEEALVVVWTPGHALGHVGLYHPRTASMIAGDLIASRGTILVRTPDGNMGQYMRSLHRVRQMKCSALLPSHGLIISDPEGHLSHYITHREAREAKVMDAFKRYPRGAGLSAKDLVGVVYRDVDPMYWPIAQMSLEAHLEHLEEQGALVREGDEWRAGSHDHK